MVRAQQTIEPDILVIDDEDYVADMIAYALETRGYRTAVAFNGKTGVELARTIHPRLVIVDIMMPVMNGFAVLSQLREDQATQSLPVLMTSASAHLWRESEGTGFIKKPFSIEDILQRVELLLGPPSLHKDA